jgi:hypothetical protein
VPYLALSIQTGGKALNEKEVSHQLSGEPKCGLSQQPWS